jgi:hypothetical protein
MKIYDVRCIILVDNHVSVSVSLGSSGKKATLGSRNGHSQWRFIGSVIGSLSVLGKNKQWKKMTSHVFSHKKY